jgi:DNA primase
VVELIWRRETEGQPLDSPERRAALDARLKAHLSTIRDESLRNHTAAALRERRAALFAASRARPSGPGAARSFQPRPGFARGPSYPPGRSAPPAAATAAAKASYLGRARDGLAAEARIRESAILLGLINHPSVATALEDRLDRMAFLCPDLGEMRDALLACLADAHAPAGHHAPDPPPGRSPTASPCGSAATP